MQLFAYDLSRALAAKIDIRLVKWGGSSRVFLPLVVPYLGLGAIWQLLKGGVDIIHVQDGVLAPLGYLLSRLSDKPYTVVLHGLDITYASRLYKLYALPAIRRADHVFCISQIAADEAKRRGVDEAKLQVIPLAVADDLYGKSDRGELIKQLSLPDDTKVLLTVGRLVKRKGVAWFITNVLPGLVEQHPQLVYLVVGEGVERGNIEAAVAHAGLEANVRLLGLINGNLYEAVYNGADAFVMPNITVPGDVEGFGLVLLEASVCALPVVAADTEGIKDAVTNDQNGVLVSVGDVGAFRREIGRFLDDADYAKRFGQASRRFSLKNYQWNKLVDYYIEAYEQLLSK
jgi:phosphatidylinositol alpha-1,6-mannosyltransferase